MPVKRHHRPDVGSVVSRSDCIGPQSVGDWLAPRHQLLTQRIEAGQRTRMAGLRADAVGRIRVGVAVQPPDSMSRVLRRRTRLDEIADDVATESRGGESAPLGRNALPAALIAQWIEHGMVVIGRS